MGQENGIRGVGGISCVNKEDNSVLLLQSSRNVALNPNFAEELVNVSNDLGIDTPLKSLLLGQDPQLQATFPRKNMTTMALALNRQIEASASFIGLRYIRTFTPVTNAVAAPAGGATAEGKGIIEDEAGAIASYQPGDFPIPLTRVATASFSATATTSFAVGTDGALQFTNDVVGNNVTINIPFTANAQKLGEQGFNNLGLYVNFVMDDGALIQTQFSRASMVLQGVAINFQELTQQLTWRANFDGTQCTGFDVVYLGQVRKC